MLITIHHQIDKFGGKMNNPCRKPSGPYLIEPSPDYQKYLSAKSAREIVEKIMAPVLLPAQVLSAAISGYREEMDHMLVADPIYLGPGK